MSKLQKSIRQSVALPSRIARNVRAIARAQKTSANRVLLELIEDGLESRQAEKKHFFALADRLTESTDTHERAKIKEELARLTFGE